MKDCDAGTLQHMVGTRLFMLAIHNSPLAALTRTGSVLDWVILARMWVAVTGLTGLGLIGAVAPAQADQLSTEDRAGIERFEGVWDVRPMRPPRGPRNRPPAPPGNAGAASRAPKVEGLDGGDRRVYQLMTSEGRAAFDKMDPRDLPTNNCRSSGVPTLAAVPYSQDWSLEGDVLTIHHEEFDTVREIYFDGRPAAGPPTQLGHANGSFSGDVLRITTTHMKASLGALSRNAPGSDARSVTERYWLSDNGQGINGEITVDDPVFLSRSITLRVNLVRAPDRTEVLGFPCDPEASRRHLE